MGFLRLRISARAYLTFAMVALSASSAFAQTKQQFDWCVNNGNVFAPDLQIDGCTAAIDSGRWSGGDLASAYNSRCQAYNNKRDYDHAVQDCSAAIKLKPLAIYLENRGNVYLSKGDYDSAIADYTAAIKIVPNADAYSGRCQSRALAGDEMMKALQDCNEALAFKPDDAKALNSRGLVELKLGMYYQAIADYDAAVAQNPKDAASLYARGVAKVRNFDKTGGGEVDIAAAKTIDPNVADESARLGVK